jgi:hypothetical protein
MCARVRYVVRQAARSGHVALCKLLVQHTCITARGVRQAVCEAASAGQLDVLQLLLNSCPDAAKSDLVSNPMHHAASTGNVQAMQLLLQHGAGINSTRRLSAPRTPDDSQWPLLSAVQKGQAPATIQWMLEQGANAGPALASAAQSGNLPVLGLLLDWGPDMDTWGELAFVQRYINAKHKQHVCCCGQGHLITSCQLLPLLLAWRSTTSATVISRHSCRQQCSTATQSLPRCCSREV